MFIIVKRAAIFLEDEYVENPQTHELSQVITNQMTVYPNQGDIPQEIPAWAEDDELCQLGIKEGWLIEVAEQSALAAQSAAQRKAEAKPDKQPTGLQSSTGSWKKP